jgi:CheY-like chemotaxis protein
MRCTVSRCRNPPLLADFHHNVAEGHGVCGSRASRIVLVVEDEPIVRNCIAQALRAAGWRVLEASTAETAITYLQTGAHIDVLFTDIQLAGRLSGWDVGERCRAMRGDCPVIYTSGNSVDRSRRVQDSLFFSKPYQTGDVIAACHVFCEGRSAV